MQDLGLKSYDKLYPMMIRKYSDLIVDQNASETDKINQIITQLNALGKLSNDVVRNWNTVYQWTMNDGLTTDVSNKVEEMKANGELDTVLQSVFASLAGDLSALHTTAKDNLVNSINEVDDLAKSNAASLAQKATKSKNYVLISDYNNLFVNNDWTTAINTAMNDLKNSGGGVLLFEAGTYNIKGNITVLDTVYLQGAGKNVTTLQADTTMSGVFINLGKNIRSGVTHLTLAGNRYSQSTNQTTGLKLGLSDSDNVGATCYGIEVHDITITSFFGNGLECYRKHWVYSMNNVMILFCTGIGFKCNCTDNIFSNFWISQCPTGLYIGGAANKFNNFKIDFCGSDTTGAVQGDTVGQICLSNIEVQGAQGKGYMFNNCTSILFANVYADSTGASPYTGNTATAYTFTGCSNLAGNLGITEDPGNASNIFLKTGFNIDANCKDFNFNTLIKGLVPYTYKQIALGAQKIILDNKNLMKNTLLAGYSTINSVEPAFSKIVTDGQVNTAHGTYVQNGDGSVTVTVSSSDSTHRLGFKAYSLQQNHVYLCYAEVDTNTYGVSFSITNNNSPFAFYGITTFAANSSGYLTQYGLMTYKDDPVAMNPSVYLATTSTGNDTFTFRNLMILDVTNIIQDVDMDTIINTIQTNVGFFYGTTKAIGANAKSDNNNGINVSVGAAATTLSVTFTGINEADTNYGVTVTPAWNTTYWITNKTTSGFTINFGTAPASASTLDWFVRR